MVNKHKNDNKIQEHLDKIYRMMPRLERWTGIYRDTQMRQLVSITYHLIITFSRAASEYFRLRWKRIWFAVNPVAAKFDEAAQSIYEALAEVNAEANQGLHERSQKIEERLMETKKSLQTLQEKHDRLQATLDAQKREDMRRDREVAEEKYKDLEMLISVSAPRYSISTTG